MMPRIGNQSAPSDAWPPSDARPPSDHGSSESLADRTEPSGCVSSSVEANSDELDRERDVRPALEDSAEFDRVLESLDFDDLPELDEPRPGRVRRVVNRVVAWGRRGLHGISLHTRRMLGMPTEPTVVEKLGNIIMLNALTKDASWIEVVVEDRTSRTSRISGTVYYCIHGRKIQEMSVPGPIYELLVDFFAGMCDLEDELLGPSILRGRRWLLVGDEVRTGIDLTIHRSDGEPSSVFITLFDPSDEDDAGDGRPPEDEDESDNEAEERHASGIFGTLVPTTG